MCLLFKNHYASATPSCPLCTAEDFLSSLRKNPLMGGETLPSHLEENNLLLSLICVCIPSFSISLSLLLSSLFEGWGGDLQAVLQGWYVFL